MQFSDEDQHDTNNTPQLKTKKSFRSVADTTSNKDATKGAVKKHNKHFDANDDEIMRHYHEVEERLRLSNFTTTTLFRSTKNIQDFHDTNHEKYLGFHSSTQKMWTKSFKKKHAQKLGENQLNL